MRCYSPFWLAYCAGLVALSPRWQLRPDPPLVEPDAAHPAEGLSMPQWLALPEAERAAVVQQYTARRPPVRYASTEEKRRQQAA